MISGESFSRVFVTRPHGKVDTPKPLDPKARMRAPTRVYIRCDACHGFLLLIFGTILFPYSSNFIDGALAQVILQVIRQLYFQTGFYGFEKFDACGALASLRNFTSRSIPLMMSEPSQLLQRTWRISIHKGSHVFIGYTRHGFRRHRKLILQTQRVLSKEPCAQSYNPLGKSEIDSATSLWIHVLTTGATTISNSCTGTDGRRSTTRIHEQDTPPMLTHSQTPLTQVISPPIPADISTAHSGVPIGHPPPTAQTASNLVDSARFTALEGMVNQLATNMPTNMTELMAMLNVRTRI
ncbi:hypothetical protein CRG98_036988 [Punica granatum]|uniref:Uncharacterized protein n=1 Tax=Punica granatum TaxID=22663 RepID=A0A2I0IF46_PUNGR|nr:hypothetical protein CRG98_036988 [Punica granatum]